MMKIGKRQKRCNADVSGTHSPSPVYSRMRGDRLEATTWRPAVGCSQRRGDAHAPAREAARARHVECRDWPPPGRGTRARGWARELPRQGQVAAACLRAEGRFPGLLASCQVFYF
jgi:hypothetical protein